MMRQEKHDNSRLFVQTDEQRDVQSETTASAQLNARGAASSTKVASSAKRNRLIVLAAAIVVGLVAIFIVPQIKTSIDAAQGNNLLQTTVATQESQDMAANKLAASEAAANAQAQAQAANTQLDTSGKNNTSPDVSNTADTATPVDKDSAKTSSCADSGSSSVPGGNSTPVSGSAPAQQPETPDTSIKVTVSAECSAAVEAGYNTGWGSGSMLYTTVALDEGSTVYDALQNAGIGINTQTTQFGVYVVAIGGLAEKQYGAQSGWKYAVNGTYMSTSCNKCVVNDGDVVEWHYVCSL